ncbi:MAG: carbon storage regulator CsrA [Prochlorococcus marinus CUG1431]|uniref:Carbon storage regulator CsrA n=1 Tax=Prochlorococcus marinus CUG1433 TaxID=2774506 RepID=A0A9D9G190_PROMR|nr:carbon storage regulator CsrA [Prochlorococcus marinus CUG1433]MBO6981304.1 carbon storage regulator CsrA [Prochlorococcus marinus CUG1431]
MKKLLIPSVFVISLFGLIYPTEKENTNLTDYCFSLEKIVAKNTFDSTNKIDGTTKMIAKGVASFGVENSRGDLTTKIIETFKSESEDSFVKLIPTKIYCLGGYWIEKFQPGTFESIFYGAIQQVVKETYSDLKEDIEDNVNNLINDLNKGYKSLQKEFNNIFD